MPGTLSSRLEPKRPGGPIRRKLGVRGANGTRIFKAECASAAQRETFEPRSKCQSRTTTNAIFDKKRTAFGKIRQATMESFYQF
jgi:hypothetical protein